MKRLIVIGTILCTIILILPAVMVLFSKEKDINVQNVAATTFKIEDNNIESRSHDISVSVYRSNQNAIENVPLEEYVVGVVASEMPVQFEMEALKAQALTARTFIVKQMLTPTDINIPNNAMVTDTVLHQVYKNSMELKEQWGNDYEWKIARIKEAVLATEGQILTFDGEPITASFFSTSNGYTENSEDYWQNQIPYLRSVESPWDKDSPRYQGQTKLTTKEFEEKLGVSLPQGNTIGEIVERTSSNRVAKVKINNTILTGRDIREKLDLDSTDFRWRRAGSEIIIETKGWGHGVGMSQYGADGMAKEGKSYTDIIKHYYQGVSISEIDPFVGKFTAKNE